MLYKQAATLLEVIFKRIAISLESVLSKNDVHGPVSQQHALVTSIIMIDVDLHNASECKKRTSIGVVFQQFFCLNQNAKLMISQLFVNWQ